MTAVLSGSELLIVALALVALSMIVVSSAYGILARLTRGRVQRPRRWWQRGTSSASTTSVEPHATSKPRS